MICLSLFFQDVLIRWLTTDDIQLNAIDAEDPEISDYNMLPHTEQLADRSASSYSLSLIQLAMYCANVRDCG